MKYIVWSILILAFSLILAGVCNQYVIDGNTSWNSKLYGGGIILLFFVWMPIFLIWRTTKTKFFDEINKKHLKD